MTDDPHAETQDAQVPTLWQVAQLSPVTMTLIAACIAVGFWTRLGDSLPAVRWLTFVDLVDDPDSMSAFPGLAEGQVWRLLTPIVLHFGIVHLLFNMMWLYDLGGKVEARLKSGRFAILLVIIALLSNVAQYLVNWDFAHGLRFDNAYSGGMSGVVYGLFGYVWIRGRSDPDRDPGLRLHQQTVVLMIGWLVLCMSGMLGYIGNTAHLVGLLVGIAAGFIAVRRSRTVFESP